MALRASIRRQEGKDLLSINGILLVVAIVLLMIFIGISIAILRNVKMTRSIAEKGDNVTHADLHKLKEELVAGLGHHVNNIGRMAGLRAAEEVADVVLHNLGYTPEQYGLASTAEPQENDRVQRGYDGVPSAGYPYDTNHVEPVSPQWTTDANAQYYDPANERTQYNGDTSYGNFESPRGEMNGPVEPSQQHYDHRPRHSMRAIEASGAPGVGDTQNFERIDEPQEFHSDNFQRRSGETDDEYATRTTILEERYQDWLTSQRIEVTGSLKLDGLPAARDAVLATTRRR